MKQIIIIAASSLFLLGCDESPKQAATIQSSENTTPDYLLIGQNIASEAQAVLGKNLSAAIQSGGSEHAVAFCNTRAIPLTDSVAVSLNAQLKRVTDKTRNPDNQANETELAYIQTYKDALANGETLQGQLATVAGKKVGYYPIITNALCMQCHGDKEVDIDLPTYKKIQKLYTSDRATGYKENEVRGLWVVEMDETIGE